MDIYRIDYQLVFEPSEELAEWLADNLLDIPDDDVRYLPTAEEFTEREIQIPAVLEAELLKLLSLEGGSTICLSW